MRGTAAQSRGVWAEDRACAALVADGWAILARRMQTGASEIDIVAERAGLLAFVEVKARPDLATAAAALSGRQQARLLMPERLRWLPTRDGVLRASGST